ncbi:hypothetical protein [Hallerella succinigenes]|uniref:Uncharacterized protein n=1 Tax=Hallerella succinigenes TaxID=1896222 RepID=A0A2M9A9T9_9BACT|nr:hypothetical protein [Hallerella succinigenes]PJJ42448.1 hypothetical protein BGX16_2476 [Hallerella succinigenes]
MKICKRICALLLFYVSVIYAADGTQGLKQPLLQSNSENTAIEIDSVDIYAKLISLENSESSYGPNIAGIAVGGGLTGVGTYFLIGGLYALNHKSGDAGDETFTAIAGGAMLGISIPLYLVGIPVLVYNIYKYNVHKKHAIKRDEYQDSLNKYKLQKGQEEMGSVQLMFFPMINFASAGFGAGAILNF